MHSVYCDLGIDDTRRQDFVVKRDIDLATMHKRVTASDEFRECFPQRYASAPVRSPQDAMNVQFWDHAPKRL
jgi:hypothetical protein